MERIEEMTAAAVAVPQALRALVTASRFDQWVAPDITVTPLTRSETLGPGDRLRMSALGVSFEYLVEAVSEREVVFSFTGSWSGRERWSFIADGSETLIRRVYEVTDGSPAAALLWWSVGRLLVMAHFKVELHRFRAAVERDPGPRGEIEAHARDAAPPPSSPSFPIDEG
jgi:hypothetical protein